jgi:hypothetical protein
VKKYKVVCLKGGHEPVPTSNIESEIDKMIEAGWSLFQLSTGSGGDANYFGSWVYLVFERQA